ncbi:type IV toxin-antitoxin system AbiEi family antitoxin domain-containing protein [Labrenzia sp. R5_0]|uniref:type IV toxin-antitoxin system AbiEi family antitoxin domain-containing protein n=1 Tax=Labrenzia sp. R5_0 TaxID=2821108 RepID=UPI001ADA78D8|nr:type IV toxin-antitoxin system AbiEi family antitoxin domain-containing protein [Labrenzia sp. R5_0]MBO9462465.1 type IV toxin-antitoxin system AbiEi family antitoxin [Labrenzia sp. R5_0]
MAEQNASLLNRLEKDLPEGLVVDAAWLEERGIASNLRAYYVKSGWLEQPVRSVYRRPRGTLSWQQVIISLQTVLLRMPLIVGGRTALELQGFAHYLSHEIKTVHLYGPEKPPAWLKKLNLPQRFIYHNSATLFRKDPITFGLGSLALNMAHGTESDLRQAGLAQVEWGQWDWHITLSLPERAYLEMLDELPKHESFHQADMIMQSAANFSPRRLQKLLADCDSVKAKRLFFFFADRHQHAWLKRLDKAAIDLGKGKRMLVQGGRLDPVYLITVPEDLDAVS